MSELRKRRTFLSFAIAALASALGAACGVKGPLYLPEEPEMQEEKDKQKDKENTSQASPSQHHSVPS